LYTVYTLPAHGYEISSGTDLIRRLSKQHVNKIAAV